MLLTSHAAQGGTLDFLSTLRRHFLARGHDAEIVALYRGRNSDPDVPMRVLVEAARITPLTFALILLRYAAFCLRRRPGVFVGVMPMANLFAAIGARLALSRSMATQHSPYATQGRLLRTLDLVFGTLGMYSAIVCVSNAVKDSFHAHPARYKRQLQVILNGIKSMQPDLSPAETRAKFELAPEFPVLLMVGRLSEQKNVVNAARGFATVSGAQLVMAGEGPLREELEALVRTEGLRGRVKLLGNVSKQDVVNLLGASAAFVQVSLYEGHSLALLEAISASAVIVVSNVPSQLEAVRLADGTVAAVTCDPERPDDVARAMRSAVFEAETRATLAKRVSVLNGRLRTEGDMVDDYEQLLRALAR